MARKKEKHKKKKHTHWEHVKGHERRTYKKGGLVPKKKLIPGII